VHALDWVTRGTSTRLGSQVPKTQRSAKGGGTGKTQASGHENEIIHDTLWGYKKCDVGKLARKEKKNKAWRGKKLPPHGATIIEM